MGAHPESRVPLVLRYHPERAVAPEETNLLRVTRDPQIRQTTWEGCREIVSLQPYTTPDDTKVRIGHETDQCSADRLTVFGDGGFYYVARGQEKWVPISNPRVHWLCGLDLGASTMPEGTNLLKVRRDPATREITRRTSSRAIAMCATSAIPRRKAWSPVIRLQSAIIGQVSIN